MGERLDYRRPEVWTELAGLFGRRFAPEPTGSCGRVQCGPEWSWRFAHHDFDLWLVSHGHGSGVVAGRPVSVAPGTLLVLRPGDSGWMVQDPQDRLTVTYTHFTFVDPATSATTAVAPCWLPSRRLVLADVRAVADPLLRVVRLREQGGPLAQLEARLLLAQVLLQVYRADAATAGCAPATVDPRVQEVMRHVRDRPSARVSLAEAAALARVSPTYLRRLFVRELGMSFRAYVLRTRMDLARSLLQESAMSVTEVARALGYDDLVPFSRQVRRYFGMSPTTLRRG